MIPTSDNQDQFIADIRNALGLKNDDIEARKKQIFTQASPAPEDQQHLLDTINGRDRQAQLALLEQLQKEAAPLNLEVIPVKDENEARNAIAKLVVETDPEWGTDKQVVQWDHPLIKALDLENALKDQNVPVHTAAFDGTETTDADKDQKRKQIRQQMIDSYIGVTAADYCLVDTASIVMQSRPSQARAVSLLPSVHVAVIRLEQILADLKELYATLKFAPDSKPLTHHMVLISGPSKTADIELVMVHGAHGPRSMKIFVITD